MTVSRMLLIPVVCACLFAASCGAGGDDRAAPASAGVSFELLLQLDDASALPVAVERKRTEVCHALEAAGITYEAAGVEDDLTVLLRGLHGGTLESAQAVARETAGNWSVQAAANRSLRIGAPPDLALVFAEARAETLQILETRLLGLGLEGARVEQSATDPRIFRVEVESSDQPADTVTRILTAPTTLHWHELVWPQGVEDPATWLPPPGEAEALAQFGGELQPNVLLMPQTIGADPGGESTTVYWAVREIPVLTAADIVRAEAVERADGVPTVEFELDAGAAARFERVTGANTGRKMAIVLRDEQGERIRSTPVIRGPISQRAAIAGGITMAEARGLTIVLTSGALPARLEVQELASL